MRRPFASSESTEIDSRHPPPNVQAAPQQSLALGYTRGTKPATAPRSKHPLPVVGSSGNNPLESPVFQPSPAHRARLESRSSSLPVGCLPWLRLGGLLSSDFINVPIPAGACGICRSLLRWLAQRANEPGRGYTILNETMSRSGTSKLQRLVPLIFQE